MSIYEALREGGEPDGDNDYQKMEEPAADKPMDEDEKMDGARIKKLLKENAYSGISVALVSATLSPALAMAQGCTAMMGFITAIYGPGLQGILGGSHYNILGPAGALVNIVSNLSGNYGVEMVPMVTIVGGVMSFLVYLVKFENYCTMLPTSVLEGFSLGVATTIGLGQLPFALGQDPAKLGNHPEFYRKVQASVENLELTQTREFLCFLPFFIVLMSLSKWKPAIPWIIVIAALGIIYGIIMREAVEPDTLYAAAKYTPLLLKDKYPTLSKDIILADFSYFSPKTYPKESKIKAITFAAVVLGAFKVAFVAVLETLISARIADNKTNTRFNQSKEVMGMAISNVACGLMGGVPCTGVLIRTNVNVQTKATHKMSQFINAVIVFFIVVLGMKVFTYIPMAVIASILMTSACRLVPKTIMRQLWNVDKFEFTILIITWLICVFKDGAVGLMVGAFLSFLKQSEKQSATQMSMAEDQGVLTVSVHGSLDYINGLHFEVKVLDEIKEKGLSKVVVDLSSSLFVDVDGLYILNNLFNKKELQGLVYMVHDGGDENSVLCKSALYKKLKENSEVFKTQSEAIEALLNAKTG